MLSYSPCDDDDYAMREPRIYREEESSQHHYCAKRPRKLSSWESSLTNNAERPGLSDLFGSRQHHHQQQRPQHVRNLHWSHGNEQRNSFLRGNFFTLRLEHREGGTMARHFGEERFLLFRSDRAGAIAKVIFSSTAAGTGSNSLDCKAKVHVLDVKSDYRGKDLGGLLFTEAMNSLMERYEDETVGCQLDAEEDIQRHDRLLRFYQHLGCEIKPKAKVQYINNNDGETYRKIPMRINVNSKQRKGHQTSMLGAHFLPIQLLGATGHRAGLDLLGQESTRRLDWLIIDDGSGHIHFRTTVGHYLRADELGRCAAVEEQDNLCFYFLYRVSDEGSDSSDEELSESNEVRRKELWMLQSTHGNFLTIDGQSLASSKAPSFWQADDQALSLTCTSDTPPRRQHYRQYWAKQTVAYVQEMRQRYLSFDLTKMTLQQALHLVDTVPCHPYSIQRKGPSTRTLCFRAAEVVRNAGQPDWVQLMSLIHELGVVVNRIDSQTAIESEDEYDWSRASRSHVVGCGAPDRTSFAEYRYLNADARDNATPQGIYDLHCGLSNVLLAWTGPEYLFHMLQHNETMVPQEGIAMLRYFTLGDWHTHDEYSHLVNHDDDDLKSFVAEFDTLRRAARKGCVEDLTREECDELWNEHYQQIADKYGLSGMLEW